MRPEAPEACTTRARASFRLVQKSGSGGSIIWPFSISSPSWGRIVSAWSRILRKKCFHCWENLEGRVYRSIEIYDYLPVLLGLDSRCELIDVLQASFCTSKFKCITWMIEYYNSFDLRTLSRQENGMRTSGNYYIRSGWFERQTGKRAMISVPSKDPSMLNRMNSLTNSCNANCFPPTTASSNSA